jgi:hypothetical protein
MGRARAGSPSRLFIPVGLALYAFVLVAAPFEHHDLVCHLKTPQHCTSCWSTQLGPDVVSPAAPPARLADAGAALIVDEIPDGALLAVTSTGRSPPLGA